MRLTLADNLIGILLSPICGRNYVEIRLLETAKEELREGWKFYSSPREGENVPSIV
jgi:hypothetical protein